MHYQKYIELGFKRIDTNCYVEFEQTGYYGFALEKNINKRQMVCVDSGNLDKPRLYIRKRNNETYHIIPITPEAVIDLFTKQDNTNYVYNSG